MENKCRSTRKVLYDYLNFVLTLTLPAIRRILDWNCDYQSLKDIRDKKSYRQDFFKLEAFGEMPASGALKSENCFHLHSKPPPPLPPHNQTVHLHRRKRTNSVPLQPSPNTRKLYHHCESYSHSRAGIT